VWIGSFGSASFTNVTIANNASGAGGSSNFSTGGAAGSGGGVLFDSSSSGDLTHVTIAANAVGDPGGGGGAGHGGGIFSNGSVGIANSIVASNTPDNCFRTTGPAMTDAGHNIRFGPDIGAFPCPFAPSGDPLLGALADNGGPTKTMALGEGSSAIDVIPVEDNCPAIDQRGVSRPQRSACDAGAFELEPPPPPPPVTTTDQPSTQPPATNPPPPPGATADTRKPVIKLAIPKQKLRRILKKGFVCTFSTDEPGAATVKFGKLGSKKFTAKKAGKQRCVIKLSKKAKKKLAKLKKLRVTVTVSVKDAAGNVGRKSKKLTLKR
jgi:hypothetical protein